MLYLVIGLFVAVAVGALLKQRQTPHAGETSPAEGPPAGMGENIQVTESSPALPDSPAPQPGQAPGGPPLFQETGQGGLPTLQEEIAPLDPVLAAKPISSPSTVASATYSSAAPAGLGDDSPYAYGNSSDDAPKKARGSATLLRWCGRTGSLQVGEFVLLGPVTYWSDGPSSTQEPCCIDIVLPVEYPGEGTPVPADGAVSYAEMTPLQRGVYLTWLAGGRIQPPLHICYPSVWLYGLERRVLIDRLDMGLCIAEAFRMLPLMRWDAMLNNLIRFITWLAVKIWLPEDELLSFCKKLLSVPEELLGMLLGPYANSKLPLPSAIAFTLARTSARLRGAAGPDTPQIAHSEELVQQFTPLYKSGCSGGLILNKPKTSLSLTYAPTNPSLASQKEAAGGVVELPNFFEDLGVFDPLVAVWRDFVASLAPAHATTAAESIEGRPDFEGFIASLRPEGSEAPLLSTLAALGDLMGCDRSEEKTRGRDRKAMVETAQVEGYQILPNLGISGRDYRWEDRILFLPLELGARLSQGYYTAAFLLEFLCALTGAGTQRSFEPIRQRLNDYFSLSTEDNVRLDAQGRLDLPAPYPPEYYGEIVQFWLQEEGRGTLRNFLMDFLSFLPEVRAAQDETRGKIAAALGVAPDAPPPFAEQAPLERGEAVVALLAPLFRNS